MAFHRIHWCIAVPYLILIALVMSGLTIYLLGFVRDTYVDSLNTQLIDEAHLVGDVLGPALARDEGKDLVDLMNHYAVLLGVRITLVETDGTVIGDSEHDPVLMESHLYRPEIQSALAKGQGSSIRFSTTADYEMMYVAVPVKHGDSIVAVVRLALPLVQVESSVARLRQTVLSVMLITLFLALLLAIGVAERTARPVRRLTEGVERMAAGDFTTHIIPTTRDEVGILTRAFNEMIDRQRETMSALERERIQLATVLEQMADGVLITDAERRVSLINPAAIRILDISGEAPLGRSLVQVVREHQVIGVWQACLESGSERVELIDVGHQGPFLQVIVTPLAGVEPGSYLMILQDLSQLRHLETIRREFITNISHELRTPLASLKALSDTLIDGALEDPPAARRFLERISIEVDALTQMVQELLELSRIESGRVPIRLAPISVSDVVSLPIERMTLQADRAGLELMSDLADLPLVLGDADRAQQVVTNLLHNAIKFTPSGGKIVISAEATEKEVVISVRDTGVGIPSDVLPHVFQRFYKADKSRSSSGTGLGLSIAQHIVQAHGGRIWAESSEGEGSIFYFSLLCAGEE